MADDAAVVVAIPARNEAANIGAALAALAAQPFASRHIAAVIVHANNCTDATVAVARATAVPFALHVIDATLAPNAAHIGSARRAATDAAAGLLRSLGHRRGIIAGTDADSRVAPDWLPALRRAFRPEIDAVCGVIDLDEPVSADLAAVRHAEAAHAAITARIACHLDPVPHDPWPRHIWSWGANLAVRADVLAAVGGSPLVDLAEDRALHAELIHHDARVRHASDVRVGTSARVKGRAPGGLADLLTVYAADPQALADFALEPAAITWTRAARRGRARQRWGDRPGFGAYWAAVEAGSAELARQRIAIRDLAAHTAQLRQWLQAATNRSDNPVHAPERQVAQRVASLR